jgi:hypothetical protein
MKHLKTTRRIWRAGVGLVVMALVVVAIWQVWPRERLLTEIARPIAPVDTKREQSCWRSERQLLVLNSIHGGPLSENVRNDKKDWKGFADLLDIDTGVRNRLSGLTNLLNEKGEIPTVRPDSFSSPDGTWFLWRSGVYKDIDPFPRMAHLDGTDYRAWSHGSRESDFYLDAQHFVQMTDEVPVMSIRDLQNPAKDRVCSTPDQQNAALAQHAMRQPVIITMDGFYSAQPTIETYRTEDSLQMIPDLGNRNHKYPKPLQTHPVNRPEGAIIQDYEVSLSQKAIVYHFQVARIHPLRSWLHRFVTKFHVKPTLTEDIWVSRADGSGMCEVGHVPVKLDEDGNPDNLLDEIHWSPDDKHVSFVYHGMLYVVLAEPGK